MNGEGFNILAISSVTGADAVRDAAAARRATGRWSWRCNGLVMQQRSWRRAGGAQWRPATRVPVGGVGRRRPAAWPPTVVSACMAIHAERMPPGFGGPPHPRASMQRRPPPCARLLQARRAAGRAAPRLARRPPAPRAVAAKQHRSYRGLCTSAGGPGRAASGRGLPRQLRRYGRAPAPRGGGGGGTPCHSRQTRGYTTPTPSTPTPSSPIGVQAPGGGCITFGARIL